MALKGETQFIGVSPDVNMLERKSNLANSPTQVYTTNDISDYILSQLPPAPIPPDYTEIPVTSSEILSMGSEPIELLTAPGEDKYYVIEKIVIEYTFKTAVYVLPTSTVLTLSGCINSVINGAIITNGGNTVCVINSNLRTVKTIGGKDCVVSDVTNLNSGLTMTTVDGDDPTDGDGYLLVKITYRTETFGV